MLSKDQPGAASVSDHDSLEPRFFNRELSWLEFNARVLNQAQNKNTPLLERLKFLTIFSSNLDEFYMVRVAGLQKIQAEGIEDREAPDRLPLNDVLTRIRATTQHLVALQYSCYGQEVRPALEQNGIRVVSYKALSDSDRTAIDKVFFEQIFPVLTPLAVDPAHPFPYMVNLALYLAVTLHSGDVPCKPLESLLGLVELPAILPRLVALSATTNEAKFVLLEDLVTAHLGSLFVGLTISGSYCVRVTRNLDYTLLESEVVDLLKAVQREMNNLEHQTCVRLEVAADTPEHLVGKIATALELTDIDVYRINGPLVLNGLRALLDIAKPQLKDQPFNPRLPKQFDADADIFSLISEGDLLVHHPYESFYPVIEFLNAAAHDPQVLAIKQTLYRTSGDTPIVDALVAAAERKKHVTAVIELKARFDEEKNIGWARKLERAGVNVVFGFVGFKTHAKATMIIRREGKKLRRYVHVGTGNYNSTTARIYTDLSLFTTDEEIGNDVSSLFNLLTGFNVLSGESRLTRSKVFPKFSTFLVAPTDLRDGILDLIQSEIAQAKAGKPAAIFAKMNGLVDKALIERLYDASQAGVKIRLLVRGICCLRPGVRGLSERIEVRSIVDRFLEHTRIFCFENGGRKKVYLSSADWMPRNMDRRVEIMFPVKDERLQNRLVNEILEVCWRDNVKAWVLKPNGTYALRGEKPPADLVRAQEFFIELARRDGLKSLPYEVAIKRPVAGKGRSRRPLAPVIKAPRKSR